MIYSWTEELHLAPSIQMKGASHRWILNGDVSAASPQIQTRSRSKWSSVMVYKQPQMFYILLHLMLLVSKCSV